MLYVRWFTNAYNRSPQINMVSHSQDVYNEFAAMVCSTPQRIVSKEFKWCVDTLDHFFSNILHPI